MRLLKSLITATLAMTTPAYSGQWSSGGGELMDDSGNPWFLANTRDVRFCVVRDATYFSGDDAAVRHAIAQALTYWREEFRAAIRPEYPEAEVATQTFTEQPCSADVDLTFQFGTLSEDQVQEFARYRKRPQQFVAVAIRTDYDPVTLRGKGFIYVSPDSGPLRFEGQNLAEAPWSMGDGGILHKVLVHELGHVFGLPHEAEGDTPYSPWANGIMQTDFAANIITKERAEKAQWMRDISGVFQRRQPLVGELDESNNEATVLHQFFDLERPVIVLSFYVTTNGIIEVYNRDYEIRPRYEPELIGTITPDAGGEVMREERIIRIRMNPEQRVFPYVFSNWQFGPMRNAELRRGIYHNLRTRTERPVFYRHTPEHRDFVIGGILDGRLIPDLRYESYNRGR